MFVFVYGTLKGDCSNHHFLDEACFIDKSKTLPEYTMYSVRGYYPAVVGGGHTPILGELYEIDEVGYIDVLEGNGSLYKREEITLPFFGTAWMYIYLGDTSQLSLIEKGEWKC